MRLDYVRIDGFKNLNGVEVDFDESQLTTVIIGENGTGKSNLIEALVRIFRDIDLGERTPFSFEIRYLIGNNTIELAKADPSAQSPTSIRVNEESLSIGELRKQPGTLTPGMVFGYYSGEGRRLENLFETHHRKYYHDILDKQIDTGLRRFFYCRSGYSRLALLANFAFQDEPRRDFLRRYLRITAFHSALIVLHQPSWRSRSPEGDLRFWKARGLVQRFLNDLWDVALAPIRSPRERVIDDYRSLGRVEERLYLYIPGEVRLRRLAEKSGSEKAFFQWLESTDISDLIREVRIWVHREGAVDEVPFHEISDGERQLMTVLGLLRYAQEQNALFLLDEPDTHLNPVWQLRYLKMIEEWVGPNSDSHLIVATHDPLTIGALERGQVQVMYRDREGRVRAEQAGVDPRGLGFTSILTQIFGLPTSVDLETQKLLDERNALVRREHRSGEDEKRLIELTEQLNKLGFTIESREPQYEQFLRAWTEIESRDRHSFTPEEIQRKNEVAQEIIAQLLGAAAQ
jgi:predicted ATPase